MDDFWPRGDQRIRAVLWRGKHLIAISTIVTVLLAVVLTLRSAKVYEATGIIQVSVPSQSSGQETTSTNEALAQNYATLLVSPGFLNAIRPKVGGGRLSTNELEGRLSASATQQTALVELHATGPSPQAAQRLAAQVADAFLSELQKEAYAQAARQQAQIQSTIANLSAEIAKLQRSPTAGVPPTSEQISSLEASRQALASQSAGLVANALARGTSATVSAPPVASASPVKPRPLLNLIAGAFLGLLIGVGLAWLREQLQPWLRSAEEAIAVLDAPLLASIPLRPALKEKDPILQESYEVLRANLFLTMSDTSRRLVAVIGPNPKVGKTATVEGLAHVTARGGHNVLIIDGDMRAATLSSRLMRRSRSRRSASGANYQGLSDILEETATLDDTLVELAPGLTLLPTRPASANPSSLLSSTHMRELCAGVRERFDMVVIDSPPLIGLADSLILASVSDAVVIVARAGLTKPRDLSSVAKSMQQNQTPIAGLVMFEERPVNEYYYPAHQEKLTVKRDPAVFS
jgi:capsular exopolysaccharide synthesis family protein